MGIDLPQSGFHSATSRTRRSLVLSIVLVGLIARVAEATISVAWDRNSEPDVAGYVLSYGMVSGQYTTSIDVGNTTTYAFSEPDPTKAYYFAVQAYNTAGGVSSYSSEVSAAPVSPALTVTNLLADRQSPLPIGAPVTLTSSATGGTPPYQFKWLVSNAVTSTVGSNWSAGNTFAWTPMFSGSNTITVWARNASSSIDNYDNPSATLSMAFNVTAPPPNSIRLVQHTMIDAGLTRSATESLPFPTTAGNWLGVAIRAGRKSQGITVTDSAGHTYRRAVQLSNAEDASTVALYYAENISGGVTWITVSTSSKATLRVAILEYAGIATANSLDGAASAQGSSATANSGSVNTATNGDLIVGVIAGNARSVTAGDNFVLEEQVPAAPNTWLAVEDQLQTVAGSASASATMSSSTSWEALVAAFKPRFAP